MFGELLRGSIELTQKDRNFWTFGDTISGSLVMRMPKQGTNVDAINVRCVQGSVLCEEWVHTVRLEFREHYRATKNVFNDTFHGKRVATPVNDARIAFELDIPHDAGKKYPPSFDYRYNNVAWSTKFAVGYSAAGSDEMQMAQFETTFRLCTIPPAGQSSKLNLEEPVFTGFSWKPSFDDLRLTSQLANGIESKLQPCADTTQNHEMSAMLSDSSLNLGLDVLQCGLVQTPIDGDDVPAIGAKLTATFDGKSRLTIDEVAIQVIEYIHTYGKDTLVVERPVSRRSQRIILHKGENDLNVFVKGCHVHNFTEDFKTEWQQITHMLQLEFASSILGDKHHHFTMIWQVPITVLSEAETLIAMNKEPEGELPS